MKKLLPALALILLLICSAALGEGTLAAPFPGDSPEAILAARIGEVLNMTYTPETPDASMNSEVRAAAANRMLADAGVILCDTPAALMAGLQGYTTDDLRTAMVPVCKVARIPLYLVMSRSAADEKGIADGEGLMRYLAENEYDDTLLFARHVEADPSDRAMVFLAEQLPVLTEVFWPAEIPEALAGGDAAAAVITEAERAEMDPESILVLFTLGDERSPFQPDVPCLTESGLPACPESGLYLLASVQADADTLRTLAETVAAADMSAACEAADMVFRPLTGDALQDEIRGIFADYKDYMTAEGLYFYE